jgi:hypothetical protein
MAAPPAKPVWDCSSKSCLPPSRQRARNLRHEHLHLRQFLLVHDTSSRALNSPPSWGIIDGFQAQFDPLGLAAQTSPGQLLRLGRDVPLRQTVDGADAAYDHLAARLARGAPAASPALLGSSATNPPASSSSRAPSAPPKSSPRTTGSSSAVATSSAWCRRSAAQPYMSIDRARDVAVIMDDKLLGTRPATEPTPIPTPFFPTLDPTPPKAMKMAETSDERLAPMGGQVRVRWLGIVSSC